MLFGISAFRGERESKYLGDLPNVLDDRQPLRLVPASPFVTFQAVWPRLVFRGSPNLGKARRVFTPTWQGRLNTAMAMTIWYAPRR